MPWFWLVSYLHKVKSLKYVNNHFFIFDLHAIDRFPNKIPMRGALYGLLFYLPSYLPLCLLEDLPNHWQSSDQFVRKLLFSNIIELWLIIPKLVALRLWGYLTIDSWPRCADCGLEMGYVRFSIVKWLFGSWFTLIDTYSGTLSIKNRLRTSQENKKVFKSKSFLLDPWKSRLIKIWSLLFWQ